ncbi:MAG: sugar ABC transporter ATP-binding protein [Anaerolineae bacterium]|nr:sugar ABC transporter ATP-binding protein [Anaerolineae bacterium]
MSNPNTANGRGEVVFSGRGLTKHYGPIQACTNVDIDIRRGHLTAIVGDNGAGKSTLVKMLTGAIQPDSGTMILRGQEVRFSDPLDARAKRVEVVYQELALAPNLDAVSNIFLGREMITPVLGFSLVKRLDESRMLRLAEEEIGRLNVKIPQLRGVPVGRMSGGQQQSVAIARAAYWTTDVLFMDEPTAALGVQESRAVLDLVKQIVAKGVAVVMISHILPHVMELADHVVVMRHGEKVADLEREHISMEDLVRLIVGA